jgi:hypothetical protein
MLQDHARFVLELAVIKDIAEALSRTEVYREAVVRHGFVGVSKMTNAELKAHVVDYSLQENNDEVNEAWETLEDAHVPE